MKKYILWILAAMGTINCGGVSNTYPALGPNMALAHQKSLDAATEHSVANQEQEERVKWNLIQHAEPHY